jgi:hypothetical protein
MTSHRTPLITLAICGLVLPATRALAQESSPEGVVRLGLQIRATDGCLNCDNCDSGACDGCDGCGYGNGRYGNGYGNGRRALYRANGFGYHNGRCSHYGAAGANGGRHGYGGNPHYSHCGIGHLLNHCSPYHRCHYPPDHGWAPPAQRPIRPYSAAYTRMFPAAWTGENLGIDPNFRHPMVYMPTDTTQLGYYYQHVPFWRPRANMIPEVPHPEEWHTPDTGVVFTGFEDAATAALRGCPADGVISDGSGVPYEQGHVIESPAEIQPHDASPVPMLEENPSVPYSPIPSSEPIQPQMVPPARPRAPLPPLPGALTPAALEAAQQPTGAPRLIPVPAE